jgi:chromosome segregation ATPase
MPQSLTVPVNWGSLSLEDTERMFGRGEVMAATPTEVLNDDIKELKSEIRENRTKIDLIKDEVQRSAVAQAQMKVELRDDIQRVALSQAEMKAELRDDLQRVVLSQAEMKAELREDTHKIALSQAEMKGEFRFVKLLLSLVLAGIAGAAWQFYGLNAKANGIEVKVNGLEAKVIGIEARLDKADARSERLESSIVRLEASVVKILEQTRPAAPPKVSATIP